MKDAEDRSDPNMVAEGTSDVTPRLEILELLREFVERGWGVGVINIRGSKKEPIGGRIRTSGIFVGSRRREVRGGGRGWCMRRWGNKGHAAGWDKAK